MATTGTTFTGASVDDYLAARGTPAQQADCRTLIAMFEGITGQPARMWGPSIVAFDSYRYRYDSGHAGEAPLLGFAIRGRDLVVYIDAESDKQQVLLTRLGPHRMGKSCLYLKRLDNLDLEVLKELATHSTASIRQRWP